MNESRRKNPRLPKWDYASTAFYHVVFCTHGREKLLGEVVCEPLAGCRVEFTSAGRLVADAVELALSRFPEIQLDALCIMPNHVHMLVGLHADDCGGGLGSFVRCVKSSATRLVREEAPGTVLWQRGYYDHVIRSDADHDSTAEYIRDNPGKWAEDKYYL